jgi:hypothetical protein
MSLPNLDSVSQAVGDSGADQRYIAVVGPLRARTAVLRLLGTLDPMCAYAPLLFAGLLPPDGAAAGQGSAEAAPSGGRDVAPEQEKPYSARSGTLLVAAENLCAVAMAVDVRALRAVVVAADVAVGRHVAGACQRPALPEGCAVALVLVAVVIDGDGSASESGDAAACAGLQVAVRRAALERMGGCAVVIMRDHTTITRTAEINDGDRVHGDPREPVPEARKLRMRRALESLVAGVHGAPLDDDLVGIHAGGDLCCFSAHAGWDSSSKIQAVLEASGVMDPPQLDISKDVDRALLADLVLDSSEPQPGNGRESDDDDKFADGSTAQTTELRPSKEEDVDEEDEDEETWLRRVAELCDARSKEIASKRAPISTPSNEPRTVPTRSSSSFVRRVSASGPENGPLSSAPVRAAAPGSGAQFFQRMLRTDK